MEELGGEATVVQSGKRTIGIDVTITGIGRLANRIIPTSRIS